MGALGVQSSALQALKGPDFLGTAQLAKEASLNQLSITGSDRMSRTLGAQN